MELANSARPVMNRGRRASAIAIAVLPIALFLYFLILGLAIRPRWDAPLGAFGGTGLVLTGPFAGLLAGTRMWSPWIYLALAWLLLFAWVLAAKRTRVGDMHWALHAAIMLIWMMCGFLSIPMV